MSNTATRKLVKNLKAKGFKEVVTLSDMRNLQKEFNKAVNEEKKALGIPPESKPIRKMTNKEKKEFEKSLLAILEENTKNNASDPGTPRSQGGGRRYRTRRRRGCRFTKKH